MAAGKEAKLGIVYEEFEPFCRWQRNEDQDILEIHLQGEILSFKFLLSDIIIF